VSPSRLVHVPAGMRHNFLNENLADLKLYTVYTGPKHAPGTIHRTKADADADEGIDWSGSDLDREPAGPTDF